MTSFAARQHIDVCHVNLAKGFRGGERQTELLIRALAEKNFRQRLVVRVSAPLATRFEGVPGLEVVALKRPFSCHLNMLGGRVVHAHETRAAQLAWLRWRFYRTPFLVTRRIGKAPSGSFFTKAIYRDAACRIGVSNSVSRTIADYSQQPTHTIYSALSDLKVDAREVIALRRRWGPAFVIVNVAALVDAQKGQSQLIQAAKRAYREGRDFRFVFVGDGEDRAEFERQSAGLENVEFTGFVDNVGDYLAAADVFALPSYHEGIGGAALDAMRAGLPTIASAVDGLPEFIEDRKNGRLVPSGDAQALYDALAELADRPEDRSRFVESGRLTAAAFTVDRMAQAYQSRYREIISRD